MTKNELRDRIKGIIKKVYSKPSPDETESDSPELEAVDTARFPVLVKFPTLHEIIIKILRKKSKFHLSVLMSSDSTK